MEFKNQTENKEEFLTVKNFKVHHTQYIKVFAELVTIKGKIYMGLQPKSYYEDKSNPRLKRILLPNEAWTTFARQGVPTLDKALKEQHWTHPQPPMETTTTRKRLYSNVILTLKIFTLIHFQTFSFYFQSLTIYSSFDIYASFPLLRYNLTDNF